MNKFLSKLFGACLVASVAVSGLALHAQAAAVPETQIIYDAEGLAYYLNKTQSGTASVSGSTVTLKKNITLSEFVALESKANVTLDLERHTVTFSDRTGFLSLAGSTFTLTDAGAVVGDGVPAVTADGGTVNIVKDTTSAHASVCGYTKGVPEVIQNSDSSNAVCCLVYNTSTKTDSALNIEDVYIKSSSIGINLTGGATTIKKASVHAAKRAIDANMAAPANAASSLNISGGTFESTTFETVNISGTGYTDANDCTAILTISGGNFIAKEANADNISLWEGAELEIPAGNSVTFSANGGAGIAASASKVTVSEASIPGVSLQNGAVFTASDSEIVRDNSWPILGQSKSVANLKNTDVTTSSGCAIIMNGATLSVEGGSVLSTSDEMDWYNFLIQGWNESQLTIKDCQLQGVSGVRVRTGSTLSLEGSTIKSTADEDHDNLGTGVYIESSSSAYIDTTDITANWGIECYGGSSLTFLGGSVTGLNPLDVDYCNPDAKICIVDSNDSGITLTTTGTSAPLYVEAEPSDVTGYGLLQLSENVYNTAVKSDCNATFVKDEASGSYVTANTDLDSYRQYLVESPVTYTVTYVGTSGAENADLNPTSVNSLKSYKLVDLTKTGYVFGGWYKDSSYKNAITEIVRPSSDLTLYAKFTKITTTAPGLNYKVATTGITLSWTKVSGASAYAVYRDRGAGMKLIKKTTALSYKDTGISNGNMCHYQVIPCFGNMTGTASREIYIKYYNKTATVKISLASTGNKLTVSGVPTSYTSYTIYRSDNGASFKALKTLSGKTKTYTDTKVTNGHKYTYYVIYKFTKYSFYNYAKSPAGAKAATCYLKKPAISYLKNTSSKAATVRWSKNASATGYQIQYGLKSDFSGAKTVTLKKNTYVSRKLSSLTKKKTYYVRMRVYKTVSKKNYYSYWSSKKSVKITK